MGGDAYWDFNRGGSHCTVQEKVSKYGGKVGKGMGMGMGVGKAKEAQRNQQKMEGFKMTYEELGKEIGSLVDRKQKQYGDSYGKSGEILRVLYPNGVKPEEYGD